MQILLVVIAIPIFLALGQHIIKGIVLVSSSGARFACQFRGETRCLAGVLPSLQSKGLPKIRI
jgi:hypothetical protein